MEMRKVGAALSGKTSTLPERHPEVRRFLQPREGSGVHNSDSGLAAVPATRQIPRLAELRRSFGMTLGWVTTAAQTQSAGLKGHGFSRAA